MPLSLENSRLTLFSVRLKKRMSVSGKRSSSIALDIKNLVTRKVLNEKFDKSFSFASFVDF